MPSQQTNKIDSTKRHSSQKIRCGTIQWKCDFNIIHPRTPVEPIRGSLLQRRCNTTQPSMCRNENQTKISYTPRRTSCEFLSLCTIKSPSRLHSPSQTRKSSALFSCWHLCSLVLLKVRSHLFEIEKHRSKTNRKLDYEIRVAIRQPVFAPVRRERKNLLL